MSDSLEDYRELCRRAVSGEARAVDEVVGARRRATNLDPNFWSGISRFNTGRPNKVRKPFKEHSTVYSVVHSRGTTYSQSVLKVGTRRADGSFAEAPDHPLSHLLRRPNRHMTGRQMVQASQYWLDLIGEAFWVMERDNVSQVPTAIYPWPGGSLWRPGALGSDGFPTSWVLNHPRTGRQQIVSVDSIVFFRNLDPDFTMRGMPPLLSDSVAIESDVEADDTQLSKFQNGANPGGFLSYPMPLDAGDYADILRRFNNKHQGGSKTGKLGILDGGAKFIPNEQTNRDMEYTKMREFNDKRILRTYGWSTVMMGGGEDLPFANFVAAKRAVWEETIIPEQEGQAEQITNQLAHGIDGGRFEIYFDHDNVPALRAAQEQQWTTVLSMRKAGVSLKESNRKLRLKLKKQDGWDKVWVAGGEVPLDQDGMPPLLSASSPIGLEPIGVKPASEVPQDSETEDARPDTGGPDMVQVEAALDTDMTRFLVGDRARTASCERRLLARNASCTNDFHKAQTTAGRRMWNSWNTDVLEPAELVMLRGLRPYFKALGDDIVANFEAAVSESEKSVVTRERQTPIDFTSTNVNDILFDRDEWDAKLRPIVRKSMETSLELSAEYTWAEMVSLVGPQITFDLDSDPVREFIEARMTLVKGINDTVQKQLAATMQRGIANGETIQELRVRIEAFDKRLSSPARSLRIARTEQGVIANSLRFHMSEGGIDRHSWLTAADEDVRNTHFVAEFSSADRPVLVGEPFSNGLTHPLDPQGSAEEVINCRCMTFLQPTVDSDTRSMTPDEMRKAFFAGIEDACEKWLATDPVVWGAALLAFAEDE